MQSRRSSAHSGSTLGLRSRSARAHSARALHSAMHSARSLGHARSSHHPRHPTLSCAALGGAACARRGAALGGAERPSAVQPSAPCSSSVWVRLGPRRSVTLGVRPAGAQRDAIFIWPALTGARDPRRRGPRHIASRPSACCDAALGAVQRGPWHGTRGQQCSSLRRRRNEDVNGRRTHDWSGRVRVWRGSADQQDARSPAVPMEAASPKLGLVAHKRARAQLGQGEHESRATCGRGGGGGSAPAREQASKRVARNEHTAAASRLGSPRLGR